MLTQKPPLTSAADKDFALAVHAGAGTLRRDETARSRAPSYHEGLLRALRVGRDILATGGSALDAVTQAVVALEDDPLFNAGRGSVFTAAGTHEMDASVMDGRDRRVGAVAGILGPRNPIVAARTVMEHSHHVLMIGEGALAFCREQRVVFADPAYFRADERWAELQKTLEAGRAPPDLPGTVGAVALLLKYAGEVAEDRCGVGMLRAERLLADGERALVERPRLGKVALIQKHVGEVAESRRVSGWSGRAPSRKSPGPARIAAAPRGDRPGPEAGQLGYPGSSRYRGARGRASSRGSPARARRTAAPAHTLQALLA
jgi:hypothetical protein